MPRKKQVPETRESGPSAFVYIVECADRTLYTGATLDVTRRVAQHNAGLGARYTAGRGPVRLVFQEAQANWPAALRREREIKHLTRAQKLDLIKEACTQDKAIEAFREKNLS